MEVLHRLDDGDAMQDALGPLVAQYREFSVAGRPAGYGGQLLHYAGILVVGNHDINPAGLVDGDGFDEIRMTLYAAGRTNPAADPHAVAQRA